ncbi:metalloendopeptidase [Saxophila tyrrhenica]|uniref:Metalloendopeptidase n=1 Tax=Saxophila tyrrhenica TaxID=1690608 RepID=A0AAV9PLX2_9PEZI|nr:metalloendopeptidase [Saxophila tyrrhenica]
MPLPRQPLSTFSRTTARPRLQWHTPFHRAQTRAYRRPFNYQRFQQSRNLFQRWAARPTFYYEVGGLGGACGGYYIYNLQEVPVSGRKRFNVVSPEFEKKQGQGMYQQVLQEYGKKLMPAYTKEHRQVQRVLDRLVPNSGLEGEEWEIHVIDDPMINAFVVPGGKVFVFRGILDVCQGDDGLAAVLGHEIAHNVAHHAAERMSQFAILAPIGILAWVFAGIDPSIVQFASSLAFTLPGSRRQEEEADYIGLMMMAESCYDPEVAVGFWGRMEKANQGEPPQFLSTHPSSHNRQDKIRGWLPKAADRREQSDCGIAGAYDSASERSFRKPHRRLLDARNGLDEMTYDITTHPEQKLDEHAAARLFICSSEIASPDDVLYYYEINDSNEAIHILLCMEKAEQLSRRSINKSQCLVYNITLSSRRSFVDLALLVRFIAL